MATFAKKTFDTARYAAARPTYPRTLYDLILKYHEGDKRARWNMALDLGCGTGQATTELSQFKRVVGIDPSEKMLQGARTRVESLYPTGTDQFRFVHSAAEDLSSFPDKSVDMTVSAQAAHWFNWSKLWPELARVMRPGGTIAVWGYSEFRLSDYPSATPLIHQYSQGTDPENSLGPHWERPGRTIVDEHLQAIPNGNDVVPGMLSDFQRIYFTGPHHPTLPSPRPVILRTKTTWDGLLGYLHTFSSLHTFHEKYPHDLAHPDGDISVRFWKALQEVVRREKGEVGEHVMVEWPLALILGKVA
ncbi:S-adenosyl-L-methionine-dependent methyltransferase [Schizophyllum commune]